MWLLGLRRYSTLELGTWNRMIAGNINTDELILGSSRAWVHFDPDVINQYTHRSVFNLGLDGTGIDLQLARLQVYVRHNRKPSLLLLALDVWTLTGNMQGGVNHPGQYTAHLDQPEIYATLCQRSSKWILYKAFPAVGIARQKSPHAGGNEQLRTEAVRGLLGRPWPEELRNGFYAVNRDWGTEFDEYKEQNPNGVNYPIRDANIQTLRNLLELCQRMQIQVILIYPPEYYESQDLTNNRQAIFAIYENLATEFKVPFWDYSSSLLSKDKRNFYNSQHLNSKGANRFSEDVASRLVEVVHGFVAPNCDTPRKSG
jgi:hypothetical protein